MSMTEQDWQEFVRRRAEDAEDDLRDQHREAGVPDEPEEARNEPPT
jgi:hypothetical protein